MDSLSLGKGDGRAVNWSHPMNNSTQLPPKSPGAYSMFGSTASLFECSGGFNLHSSLPVRGGGGIGNHKRTPSAGYFPTVQPTRLEEILESPDGDIMLKKGSHRRSSSDSVAFLDTPYDFSHFVENVTEEDEFVVREPPPPISRPHHHRRGVSADFESAQYDIPPPRPSHRRGVSADFNNNRLDKEQLMSVFSEVEPFQRRQPRHGIENLASRGPVPSNLVRPGSCGDSWHSEKGKKHVTLAVPSSTKDSSGQDKGRNQRSSVSTPENRSTASDSNSHSDDSNDELRAGSNGRHRSEPEVQSRGEGDRQSQGDGSMGSEQLDPSLDPKKAKRILANRQSAQRSRVRKLQYISELERSVNALQTEVTTLSPQVGFYDHRRALLTAENVLLKQKLATLTQTQRYKEAHNEVLKKEVQKLLQIYTQQQQHLQHAQHRPLSPNTYDLQQQQFSKLDLGPSIPKPKSPDVYASGTGPKSSSGSSSLFSTSAVPPQARTSSNVIRPPSHAAKGLVSSGCMVPNNGKSLEGRMMSGTGTLPSDFLVHNS